MSVDMKAMAEAMKVRLVALGVAISLAFTACESESGTIFVPFVSLISRGELFDDRTVAVVGYLGRAPQPADAAVLYLTRDHAIIGELVGTFEVDARADIAACLDSYVEIEGTFSNSALRLSQVVRISLKTEDQQSDNTCFERRIQ